MKTIDKIQSWKENHPKIPEGLYKVKCIHASKETFWHPSQAGWIGSEKAVLFFEVFETGEHEGKIIPMFLKLPHDGKILQGSKYFKYWVMSNGWQRPIRNRLKEMAMLKFVDKFFIGNVVTVSQSNSGELQPEPLQYSRVEVLTEILAGDTNLNW